MLGPSLENKYVIHVADLNNEGSSPRDKWVPAIRKAGGKIEHIFFYVDRMEDGVKVMQDLGLKSDSLVPLDEHAWNYLKSNRFINDDIYKNLRARLEDRHSWAISMLKSERGFQRLIELHDNPKTTEKFLKIIRAGYPDVKDEFIDRAKKINRYFSI